jgi:16S rRNA (guanine527-N7)-methyltransferase
VFADLLRDRLAGIVELSTEQLAALEAHYQLLELWNRRLNLTSIEGIESAVERHYCESLFVGQALEPGSQSIADIGSGPGFPGLPLAILRPNCPVTLIESHQRKAVFLKEASRRLSNVRVLAKRAEAVDEAFDWVVSRAVSYADLSGSLQRLAPKVALLTGSEAPPLGDLGYIWLPEIRLPWGKQRFLRVGNRCFT